MHWTGTRGLETIDRRMDSGQIDRMGGVLLLFEGGGRPDTQSIHAAVDKLPNVSISHDPLAVRQNGGQPEGSKPDASLVPPDMCWLELVSNGLTFDLTNLAPGRSAIIPVIQNRFGLPDDVLETTLDGLCLLPGPHLSGGINSLPVVRAMLELVANIGAALATLRAVCWPPAAAMIGPDVFRQSIDGWVTAGPFPAQILTAFKQMSDGGLQSQGLAFFTGQEIRIEPNSVGDLSTATQLASRLVQQLVQHGPLMQTEDVMAPDGSQMRLEPSGNGKFVRVWRS